MTETTLARLPFNAGVMRAFMRMEGASYLHVPIAIFWSFVYPVMLFFILNLIFGGGDSPTGPEMSYADYLITGLVVMTLISTSLFSFTVVLVEQRANGNMRVFGLMPFSKGSYFLGFVSSRMLILLVFCALFIAAFSHLAPGALGIGAARLLGLMVYIAAGTLVLVGLSLVLASLIRRTATAHAVANIVNIPIIFLSDLFLPAAILPASMLEVVRHSPFYLFVNHSRSLYAGTSTLAELWPTVAVMIAAGALLIWFATRRFDWNPDN